MCNAAVAGKVTIEVSDATLGELCYVQGGTHGNGKEGIRDIANLNIETNAYVNEVEITVIAVSYTHLDVYKRQIHKYPWLRTAQHCRAVIKPN